jgi:hypothetical protein
MNLWLSDRCVSVAWILFGPKETRQDHPPAVHAGQHRAKPTATLSFPCMPEVTTTVSAFLC